MQTVHNARPTERVIIGNWVYDLSQIASIHIVSLSANGRPNELQIVTPQGIRYLYDEEAMVMWDLYTIGAIDTVDSLARYKQELEDIIVAEAQGSGRVDPDQQQPPQHIGVHIPEEAAPAPQWLRDWGKPPQYIYVYTPEDVQTYLDVSRALDCVKNRNVIALVEQGLVKPDDLRTWSVIAQALGLASFYIKITDWDTDRVEVHRLPGETPHGQWKEWVGDGAATRLIAKTLTDVERQKAND